MPWYVYLALKHLFPTGRRFPFLTLMSLLGVALGVGLLVVVMSVMAGFHDEIRRMIVDTEGEIQVRASGVIQNYPQVLKKIQSVQGVAAATPYAAGYLLAEHDGHPSFPMMRGLDMATVENVVNLRSYIAAGSLDDLDDDSVILASGLAKSMGVGVGSKLELYSPLILQKLQNDEVMYPREVRVAGILYIGHQQLDSNTVYCTLRLAQDLYGLGSDVHGINVRTQPGADEDVVAARLNGQLPFSVRAYSWMDSFGDFLWVVQMEKNMMFLLLTFIVVVAGFSVASSLLISVVRKTREIGVLSAIGGSRRKVASCFCFQGLFIGVFGTIGGVGLGLVILALRNDIILGITRALGRGDVLERFYQFPELPAHTTGSDLTLIICTSIVISTLAGLLPAWRASRLQPVEALRSE